jgi:hypothetical protein
MALKLRPTGLGSGAGKDDPDFVVYSGEWHIGRIYERRGFRDDVRWSSSRYGVVLTTARHTHRWRRGDAGGCKGRVRGELEAVA